MFHCIGKNLTGRKSYVTQALSLPRDFTVKSSGDLSLQEKIKNVCRLEYELTYNCKIL